MVYSCKFVILYVRTFSHIVVFKRMIDLSRWHASIGYFNSKRVNCYIGREFISSTSNVVLLYAVVTAMCDVAVLQTYMYVITVLLLLCGGDIEMNPEPVHKVCPNCNIHIHIKRKSCKCGYVFYKKCSKSTGSGRSAGFTVSSGCPVPTTIVNVELGVHIQFPMLIFNLMYQWDGPLLMLILNLMYQWDIHLLML